MNNRDSTDIHSFGPQAEASEILDDTMLRDIHGTVVESNTTKRVNLAGADLSGKIYRNADLEGAILFKANLRGADLSNANLANAELTGADLTDANLEGANLTNAGLGMAVLENARLFSATLVNATLSGANLEGADLRRVVLEDARVCETNLTSTDFTGATLVKSDFTGSCVEKASFIDADMRGANLHGVTGYEKALWGGVDLRDVNFSGAYMLHRFARDQNYIKEFRERSRYTKFLYYLWWITSDCGRSISRWVVLICIVALLYAGLYTLVEIDYGAQAETWFTPLYYSIVTMTSLGYGDVLPLSLGAQALAVSQVLLGYIMLGGLLSIFSNKLARRAD